MESESQLIWGVIFGAIGFAFALYGKRQKAAIPLVSGVGLMIVPYLIGNVYALVAAGVALMALPYFVRI